MSEPKAKINMSWEDLMPMIIVSLRNAGANPDDPKFTRGGNAAEEMLMDLAKHLEEEVSA